MTLSQAHLEHWRRRLALEAQASEKRRREALAAADRCAADLSRRWPSVAEVWLFGSVLGSGFTSCSDLDLAVKGLPRLELLAAMAAMERISPDIPVDLVRLEDLDPHWQQRIRERGKRLAVGGQPLQ